MIDKLKAEIETLKRLINLTEIEWSKKNKLYEELKALEKYLKWAEDCEKELKNKLFGYVFDKSHTNLHDLEQEVEIEINKAFHGEVKNER